MKLYPQNLNTILVLVFSIVIILCIYIPVLLICHVQHFLSTNMYKYTFVPSKQLLVTTQLLHSV